MRMSSAELETNTPRNRAWCAKMVEYFRNNRNRISPGIIELPDCDFFNVAPRRTLRVLRPELKSERFYEPPTPRERPESINDNFYSRWARRPHPSGNCRCSFRQSANSSRLSSHDEQIISQEIQRIRSSLCEAEKTGRDIEELEKSLSVDLTQLQGSKDETDRISAEQCVEPVKLEANLEEHVKKKIVKDLDRYISDLLDEILNDTIRAIAKAERPFDRERRVSSQSATVMTPATFDISFAFHNSDDAQDSKVNGSKSKAVDDKVEGYVNQGFVGSASDPDALDFHLRGRLNGDAILENIDSGINSVETVELQPEQEQEQNLEQSLIDIIDAKLGGTSIGKSLEDLGMEIDATDDAKVSPAREQVSVEVQSQTIPEMKEELVEVAKQPKAEDQRRVTIKETAVNSPAELRTSKSLDDVIEEPFNSLRLEFKRNSHQQRDSSNNKDNNEDPKPAATSSNVTSRVNKTVSVIRKRIATRFQANSRRKPTCKKKKAVASANANNNNNSSNNNNNNNETSSKSSKSKSSTRSSLELEDYRRRFPVPETNRRHYFKPVMDDTAADAAVGDEVTLRNRSRKPMIVFLHGFGSSAEAFEQQLRYFADLGYPCIAPDLLGHGMSSAPNRRADYQFEKLLKDLETLLLHYAFKPGQKCVLVAHNYGCSFATALANKYTSNVHQLVLISGGGPTPLAPPLSEGPGHCCLRASLAPLLVCGMNRAVLYSARGRQHPYCGGELLPEQWPSHMRHVLHGMTWADGDYVFHRRICTPTLLVHGLRDNKVSLVQECQMERTMIKAFLEAIPAAGHMPMTDCPEQLNHMIHCFIDLWKNKKW